jgi:type III restriction enzyme
VVTDLKIYQRECLGELAAFLRASRDETAERAFNAKRRPSGTYKTIPGWRESAVFPYVCVRVPTGGGKTLMAAHAVPSVCKNYLQTQRQVVLWLAPSDAIVQQTWKQLRDPGSATHKALAEAFGGQVAVLNIEEALYVTPATLGGACTVIVSTAQSWRVEGKDGRKVYQPDNGALMGHFDGANQKLLKRLEKSAAGKPEYSLANVLRLHRPIVIIDEGHRFRTKLTFETLKRFSPCAVVEFTATPYVEGKDRVPSNVLVEATAADLKAEHMIKAPIVLKECKQWTDAVRLTIAKRKELDRACKADGKQSGKYIRPIVLLQAQPDLQGKNSVTVEVLRKHLIEQDVPESEIAVHTGEHKGLPDNILSDACPVNFVITMQALGEGWDCPFAYVLCSVATLSSSVAVEQILGRVLRMPHVTPKEDESLNRAYCFTSSGDFGQAAENLKDALVDAGFGKDEAEEMVQRAPDDQARDDHPAPLFRGHEMPIFVDRPLNQNERAQIEKVVPGEVRFEPTASGAATTILYRGEALGQDAMKALSKVLDTQRDPHAAERFRRVTWGEDASPAAMKVPFTLPGLALPDAHAEGGYSLFDGQHKETHWTLFDCSHELDSQAFDATPARVKTTEVDVGSHGEWVDQYKGELAELVLWQDQGGPKTLESLSAWLDREVCEPRVTQTDKRAFLDRVLIYLTHARGLSLEALVSVRWRLTEALSNLIDDHRIKIEHSEFQHLMKDVATVPKEPHPSVAFPQDRGRGTYPNLRVYKGSKSFDKHYFTTVGEMKPEETLCAQHIAAHENTQTWVRNLDRLEFSFWLPTLRYRYYPDFIVKLHDGRYAAVEYKGEQFEHDPDEQVKQDVGRLWQARSGGTCVFVWATINTMEDAVRTGLAPSKKIASNE